MGPESLARTISERNSFNDGLPDVSILARVGQETRLLCLIFFIGCLSSLRLAVIGSLPRGNMADMADRHKQRFEDDLRRLQQKIAAWKSRAG